MKLTMVVMMDHLIDKMIDYPTAKKIEFLIFRNKVFEYNNNNNNNEFAKLPCL